MRAVIHSKKHYNQLSQGTVSQGAILNTEVLKSIEGASSTPAEVVEGASVKAVWVEYWIQNASASVVGSFTAGLYKLPGTGVALNATTSAALHDYANKKNILYTTQALAPTTDSGLMLVFKGWIKIPKGKQRMGLGDKVLWFMRNNNATALDIHFCGLFIFKEYN